MKNGSICHIVAAVKGNRFPEKASGDLVIAADAGYLWLTENNVTPDLVIGDFDSAPPPKNAEVLRFPKEKDDTDTLLAIREGLSRGYRFFRIYGAIGGLLDHTLANLQSLAFLSENGAVGIIVGDTECVRLLESGESVTLPAKHEGKRVSLFAYGEKARASLSGLYYAGDDILFTDGFPLGVGNLTTEKEAVIKVKEGQLLLVTEVPL